MLAGLALAAATGAAALVAGTGAASASQPGFVARASAYPGFSGGDYTVSSGEVVHVFSTTPYSDDAAFNQRWADFMTSLPHGGELSLVTVYLAPLSQIQSVCGSRALACYDPLTETIFTTG